MRRRILTIGTLALVAALVALAGPAQAIPPDPNHTRIAVKGRHLVGYDFDGGTATCSWQGELVDTNGNGLADALRGRVACVEGSGVARFRIYSTRLQVLEADTWRTIAADFADVVSEGQPARVVNYTPVRRYCPVPPFPREFLTYRVQALVGIRWFDGTLFTDSRTSFRFDARAVQNTEVCP